MTALTVAEAVAAREFCGYPAYGAGPTDATFNRFSVRYELFEYRLGTLSPEELTLARDHLTICGAAKTAWRSGADNLDTASAAVWTHNQHEMRERRAYYTQCRRDFCTFLGVPEGPAITNANSISFIV